MQKVGFWVVTPKKNWSQIKEIVYESIIFSAEKGEMSIDQRRGIINLIPKKDKDIRLLKNWRPISLLNTDYKVLTKLLATRLKKVLPTVIHPDQVAYLKSRYIGQNIRTIIDIMDYTEKEKKQGLIAFLDFEKAFDSIDWRVLDDALRCFNIGQEFRKWVTRIYKNSMSCVTNCGFSSENFNITRGVRQGCPLSAYLFITVVEILAIKIRNDRSIQGIKIGNDEVKVIQMADDTTTFLHDVQSLKVLVDMLDNFHKYAGLRLNQTKSEIMWLGSKRDSTEAPLGLKMVKGAKALGIYFSYDKKEVEERNFTHKLKELKTLLGIWSQRDLSILGRITIFKSLAFSKVIYQCSNLAVPDNIVKELTLIAFGFIWQHKPDKVKRNTVIAGYEEGGLKMLDVESVIQAQKVMWVKRLLANNNQGSWKFYPNLLLEKLLQKHSFHSNTNIKKIDKSMPSFYLQLFKAWGKTKDLQVNDPFELRREILWQNKNILLRGKEICYKEWYQKGIIMFHDILCEDGSFKTMETLREEFQAEIKALDYNALISVIPRQWKLTVKSMKIPKEAISNQEQPFIMCNNRLLALSIVTNRDVYWKLVTNKKIKPICATAWSNRYDIEANSWKDAFRYFATIKDTRMKAFQFKILNNLLPCNLYLKRIGKSDTDKCPACNVLDDLSHYLVHCPETSSVWNQVTRWWKEVTGEEVILSERDILLGLAPRTSTLVMQSQLNDIITAIKWNIHANKQLSLDTCLYQILCTIRNMINIQGMIATKNEKGANHERTWGIILDHLT